MMPRSLQGRLLLLVLGVVVAVWFGTALVIWRDARSELDDLLDGHLAQAASLLVVQQGNEIGDGDLDIDAPALHRFAPKVAFQVLRDGDLLMRSANAPKAPMMVSTGHAMTGFAEVELDGIRWRVFGAYGAEHALQVYVAERIDSRAAILWAVLRGMMWPALAIFPLLAILIAWSVNYSVDPLRRLGLALARRKPDQDDPIAIAGTPSELAPTIDALNGLFSRTTSLLGAERRFTADAAHELRTPIAAISAQAQVALAETDSELRRHALHATLQGCQRAAHLVSQLLMLSRLEAEALPLMATLELGTLVRGVLADLTPGALNKQQTIELDAEIRCQIRGDATLLGVLVRNLADNAIRYSPPGALIRVRVDGRGDTVRLTLEDSGPGMQDEEMRRAGERFFRVLGNDQEGSGLGWSIVRRIAAVHAARLHIARSPDLGGLCVIIEWTSATATEAVDEECEERAQSTSFRVK